MICFYHRGDLDGHCSGAIVRHRFPECRMIGIDYEDEFPWQEVRPLEDVYMVDFSLPMDDMRRLRELAFERFFWIDHHKTAIDKAREAGFETTGLRVVGKAGCELTWEYLFPEERMPGAVRLLGRYDVYDEQQPNWVDEILPFQYGMRGEVTDPSSKESIYLWRTLLNPSQSMALSPEGLIAQIIKVGPKILTYQRLQDEKLMARHAFYTCLDDVSALVVNHGPGGSMKFEAQPPFLTIKALPPLCISCARLPQKKWLVNLYTFRDDVDCGEIARRHGGGGHRKAAGFICGQLPFEI